MHGPLNVSALHFSFIRNNRSRRRLKCIILVEGLICCLVEFLIEFIGRASPWWIYYIFLYYSRLAVPKRARDLCKLEPPLWPLQYRGIAGTTISRVAAPFITLAIWPVA